jgi:hypothetical protein
MSVVTDGKIATVMDCGPDCVIETTPAPPPPQAVIRLAANIEDTTRITLHHLGLKSLEARGPTGHTCASRSRQSKPRRSARKFKLEFPHALYRRVMATG